MNNPSLRFADSHKRDLIMRWKAVAIGILLSLLLAQGCAGDREARELAGELRRLTAEYEASRGNKVQAEERFYRDQRQNLRQILGGTTIVTAPGQTTYDVKKTVSYGRIVTAASRDSVVLAEALATSSAPPDVWAEMLRFLDEGLKEDRVAYLETQQRQQQLRSDLLAGLAKIDPQTQLIENIRNKLIDLENEPSIATRMRDVYVIGIAVANQLNSDTTNDD